MLYPYSTSEVTKLRWDRNIYVVVVAPLPAISNQRLSVLGLSLCLSVRACVSDRILRFLNILSYKLFVGISPNLPFRCSWEQRWTDNILMLKGQRSRSRQDQIWSESTCTNMHCSGKGTLVSSLSSKTIYFKSSINSRSLKWKKQDK